jgi:hypothetical protein
MMISSDARTRDIAWPGIPPLNAFLARLLGWDAEAEIKAALRACRLATTEGLPLVISGHGDQVAIAREFNNLMRGTAPFIMCDPRRRDVDETVRSPRNVTIGINALRQARGGSLCVWSRRLPLDFDAVRVARRGLERDTMLIVCGGQWRYSGPHDIEPIDVPPLSQRPDDIPRIILQYAQEACGPLLGPADRRWIETWSAGSVTEIETGVHRLTALRKYNMNIQDAAGKLQILPASLRQWLRRRGPLPIN